jgi:small conductance mechanosensitive channel
MDLNEAALLIEKKLHTWARHLVALLPNFLLAIVAILFFGILARYLSRLAVRLLSRATDNVSFVNLTGSVLRIAITVVGLFVALDILELEKAVSSLLAGAGIIGLALGFAFQDLTANFLSGTYIAIKQPIRVGDVVETNGYFGQIREINLRSTIIDNFSGQYIEIPSKDIFQKPIINFSKSNARRMQLNCGVSYRDDLQKAQDLALQAIQSLPFLQEGKPVEFHYQAFGDNSITFLIWFWIDQAKAGPPLAMSEAIKAVKKIFEVNKVTIPFPIRTLELTNNEEVFKSLAQLIDNHKTAEDSRKAAT